MARKLELRVVPAARGGWAVVGEGTSDEWFTRKRDATAAGRSLVSRHGGGVLVIQSLSGRIVERDQIPAR
jgi:hypothetical protein